LENQQLNSGPARAATFARQGYIAFTWDMVGYVDNAAISHRYAIGHRENIVDREALWSVNLLGLQLWNAVRSVDFLLTLPEVDPERIACTGESGGGTQTFLLAAVDDRIKVAAPVNMVSFLMQGGSLCENAPNLRIDTNNVEIASLMAPRPMMMVSATGDWTKNTMSSEYPAVRNIYRLFGAGDKVTAVQMDAPHNYNQPSREAVYGWFAHWMKARAETAPIRERGGAVATINDLLVFFGRERPANELNEAQLTASLIEARKKQLDDAQPRDAASLESFRQQFGEAFRYSLMAEYPDPKDVISGKAQTTRVSGATREDFVISRRGKEDKIFVTLSKPASTQASDPLVLLVTPETANATSANSLIESLNKAGHGVMLIRTFPGERKIPDNVRFFTTYNRTDEANRVQDILTAIAYLKGRYPSAQLSVVGTGQAGLWALLARGLSPAIDRMVVDVAEFDSTSDEAFVKSLPIPGIRRAGDLTTAVTIAPLTPLLIHNTGNKFRAERIKAVYKTFGKIDNFKAQTAKLGDSDLAAWLSSK
jgi:dienelactone hydrolase